MTKKLISLLLALTMVFACAVPVMAINASDQIVNPDTGEITYQASYTQLSLANAPTDDDGLTVYLTIQSDSVNNQYITRYYYPVYMSTTDYSNGVCFVGDVLRKASSYYNWLDFYSAGPTLLPGGPTDNVYGVSDSLVNSGNTVFAPVTSIDYMNGWRFRINGKYVYLNSSDYPSSGPDFDPNYDYPVGATIETAYVSNGDHIELFFGHTNDETHATRRLYVDAVNYLSSPQYLVVRLYESHDYYTEGTRLYDPGDGRTPYNVSYWTWTVTNYARLTSLSNYDISVVIDDELECDAFFSNGYLVVDMSNEDPLDAGTHIAEILPTFDRYTRSGVTYGIPYTSGYIFSFASN